MGKGADFLVNPPVTLLHPPPVRLPSTPVLVNLPLVKGNAISGESGRGDIGRKVGFRKNAGKCLA